MTDSLDRKQNLVDYFIPCVHYRIETENISIRRQMPLSAYIGYLSTWSAWQKYQKAHPGANELNELHTK